MNKTKIISSLIAISLIALPIVAFGQIDTTAPGSRSIPSLENLATKIGNFMWIVFGIVALVAFIAAGILFLTAGGQPEKIAAARQSFIWGVAGVVVAILAYSIVAIIKSFITT